MTPLYSLTIPGNPTIEINQDELRSLLGQIEAELHRSKVYRRALATVQKMFGDSSEQAKQLFKAIGREAIGLAFHQFAQQKSQVEEKQEPVSQTSEISVNSEENSSELSACLTSAKFHPKADTEVSDELKPQPITNIASSTAKVQEKSLKMASPLAWLKNKKPSKAELAKLAESEKRLETLREIGIQLRQARELQGLSLLQLNIYTHVPVHQMEAIENGNWENLPEEVFVRGFIRVMGNALGLNGTRLVGSLPAPEPAKTIAPIWYKNEKSSGGMGLNVSPMHLYVGYTALVAGAVGGLSLMTQQTEAKRLLPDNETSSPFTQTLKENQPDTKPGLQSNSKGISVGSDIAPPEAL